VKPACLLLAPLLALALPALASTSDTALPTSVEQGALVLGHTSPGNQVSIGERAVRVGSDGAFAFGIGRDEAGPLRVDIHRPDRTSQSIAIVVTTRQWPIERVVGVPPSTVNPPPEIAQRIAREQAAVAMARLRDDDRDDYEQAFQWPVQGRVSGRFGNQRVYVLPDGTDAPRSPHSGMDIAAATGAPVLAPGPGIVTFVGPELYLTGGTVVLDHGHGVSSNFLHLSRIDVRVGDRVAEGQRIGAVGATGRATGPHLHWGMNWFDIRIDPLLVLARSETPRP
jgi:hypothetical protein